MGKVRRGFMMVCLVMCFVPSHASADVIGLSRTNDYTINPDGTWVYSISQELQNTDTENATSYGLGWSVFSAGSVVASSGWESFSLQGSGVFYAKTYGFDSYAAAGSDSVTRDYLVDQYSGTISFAAGETKTVTISYSGSIGALLEKSANPAYPYVNAYGYWEFVVGGMGLTFNDLTSIVNLPDNLDSYELLGWDVLPTLSGNTLTFSATNIEGLDVYLVFNTNTPLSPVPLPAPALLLASGLLGLAGIRRKAG